MSKFKKNDPVVWHGEMCKITDVLYPVDSTQYIYRLKNYHRDETIKAKESELRKPKRGEFLKSKSLSSPEEGNGPEILTKIKEVENE